MTNVLVLYYSMYGHIETVANAVAEGARSVKGTAITIKRVPELMPEDVLEVLCERPPDAMGEIEKVPGVKEVALFGKGLHVVAEDGEATAEAVRALLKERGYEIERVEKIVPSLEDVFVSLIEARDRAEQPQQAVQR